MLNTNLFQGCLQIAFLTLGETSFLLHTINKFGWLRKMVIGVIIAILVAIVPIWQNSSIVEILHGIIGDLSATSCSLLLLCFLRFFYPRIVFSSIVSHKEQIAIIIAGVILYLSALGFMDYDFYQYGYANKWLLCLIVAIIFALIIFDRSLGYIWLIALIANLLHTQASNNLWDYLFDPVLWVIFIIVYIYNFASNKQQFIQ